jgi:hypothetical protein
MAIAFFDSRNPAYNGNLTTTNGAWRVEASNLAGVNNTALALSVTRTIALTFANAGNLRGFVVGLGINGIYATTKGTVTLTLRESGVTRETISLTKAQIIGNTPTTTQFNSFFTPTFEFNYPVTTAVGVWTIEISNSGAEAGNWQLATSNGTAPFFVAVCNNQITATSGQDAIVVRSPVNINSTFVTKCNGLGTGDIANGASVVLLTCDNRSSPDNICNLTWENPNSSYTFTVDGVILDSADSGFRIGTSANPIPFAQQANLVFAATPSFGTSRGRITLRSSNANCGGSSFICYGEVPTQTRLEVLSNANTGQPNLTLTSAPTSWQANDRVWLPKTASGLLSYTLLTISSVSGSQVTLTANIGTQIIAGSPAINFERYGVRVASETTAVVSIGAALPNNLVCKGVLFDYAVLGNIRTQTGQGQIGATASTSKYLIEDCVHIRATTGSVLAGVEVPTNGLTVNRLYTLGQIPAQNLSFTYGGGQAGGPYQNSGIFEIIECVAQGSISGSAGGRLGGVATKFEGNYILQSAGNSTFGQASLILEGFVNGTFKNNTFWRQNTCIVLATVIAPTEWSNNKFDFMGFTCYAISGYALGVKIKGDEYGQEGANTNTVWLGAGSYSDFQIQDSLGTVTVVGDQKLITENNIGSLRAVNENQVANVDKIWNQWGNIVRTGTSLADTTTHNGGFAIRLQSNDGSYPLKWTQQVPTGNIQTKSMMVGVWIKINSTNYWSSTHRMPRLKITYDNGTEVYSDASQTTEWQFVFVPFTPITQYGVIDVEISTQTIVTGTSAHVYFDDMSVLYPAGHTLNLGDFNLWANALPIVPSISTTISPQDVWALGINEFGLNTIGEKVSKSATVNQVGQLLADALNA